MCPPGRGMDSLGGVVRRGGAIPQLNVAIVTPRELRTLCQPRTGVRTFPRLAPASEGKRGRVGSRARFGGQHAPQQRPGQAAGFTNLRHDRRSTSEPTSRRPLRTEKGRRRLRDPRPLVGRGRHRRPRRSTGNPLDDRRLLRSDDYAIHITGIEHPETAEWRERFPADPAMARALNRGWVWKDGQLRTITTARIATEYDRPGRRQAAHDVVVIDDSGEEHRLHGEIRAAANWHPWSNVHISGGLTCWECNGQVGYGDSQARCGQTSSGQLRRPALRTRGTSQRTAQAEPRRPPSGVSGRTRAEISRAG